MKVLVQRVKEANVKVENKVVGKIGYGYMLLVSFTEGDNLNIIDYMTEYKNEFKSSHFWFKNNKIQIIWYLWEDKKKKADYKITHEKLLDLALSEDLKQIKKVMKFVNFNPIIGLILIQAW